MFVKHTPLYLKSHTDTHTLTVGGINISLSLFDKSSRQFIPNQEMLELIDAISQMDLTDIYTAFLPNKKNIYSSLQNSTHTWTKSKFQQIQENLNNSLQPIKPLQIKARYQQQKAY